jgi:hypothetical protein
VKLIDQILSTKRKYPIVTSITKYKKEEHQTTGKITELIEYEKTEEYVSKSIPFLSRIISRYDLVIQGPLIPILNASVPTVCRIFYGPLHK